MRFSSPKMHLMQYSPPLTAFPMGGASKGGRGTLCALGPPPAAPRPHVIARLTRCPKDMPCFAACALGSICPHAACPRHSKNPSAAHGVPPGPLAGGEGAVSPLPIKSVPRCVLLSALWCLERLRLTLSIYARFIPWCRLWGGGSLEPAVPPLSFDEFL